MKNLIFFACLFLVAPNFLPAQSLWAEFQHNYKYYKQDSSGSTNNTLEAFYMGKEIKNGFSVNVFSLATKGWGELLILPTWTKQTKAGLFSFSFGGGIETATKSPRIGTSVFYLKD